MTKLHMMNGLRTTLFCLLLPSLFFWYMTSKSVADPPNGWLQLTVQKITTGLDTEPVAAYKLDPAGGPPVLLVGSAWTQLGNTPPAPCSDGHVASRAGVVKTYEHSHNAFIYTTNIPIGFPVKITSGLALVDYTEAQCYNAWVAYYTKRYGNNFACEGHADFSHNCHSFSTDRTDHWVNNVAPILSVEYKTPDPADHSHTKTFMLNKGSNGNYGHSLKYDHEVPAPCGGMFLFTKEKNRESQLVRTCFFITSPLSPPGPGVGGDDWRRGDFWTLK